MNKQQFFDETARLLIKQGTYAYSPDNMNCQYRDEQGNKCGIGQHIPADEYTSDMEENSASGMFEMSPTLTAIVNGGDVTPTFMDIIQTAHDGGSWMTCSGSELESLIEYPDNLQIQCQDDDNWLESFKGRMRFIAQQFNLDPAVVA